MRCLDVFQVYSAEGGRYALHGLAEFLRVFLSYLDVEHVDATIYLEEQSLALHHRFSAHCPDVSKSEHCCAVADHGYEVSFVGIFVSIVGLLLYFQTRERHTGRICQTQVGLGAVSLGRLDFDFSWAHSLMIGQRCFFCDFYHKKFKN